MTQLSGTYNGLGRDVELVLRLDIDGSTALNMLSGELNQSVRLKDFNYLNLRKHSFIGDDITYAEEGNRVVFTTPIRFFRLPELTGSIKVEIDPSSAVARLKLTGYGYHKQPLTFALEKTSDYFRDIRLEIDYEKGTEMPEPFKPWSTESHPAGMPEEPISIQGAFQRSGIDVVVHSDHTPIPTAATGIDSRWTSAELHAAMNSYFSLISTDPTWNVYLLIGMEYINPGVSGIMFDSGDPLPRQGVAVFYEHFKDLSPDGVRARNFVRTTVHELGHAFNLLHSFQKGVFSEFGFGDNPFMMPRSDSLSYMNYPWRYPYGHNRPSGWNGTADYWARFPFAFDKSELMHLRHHDRLEVIFGGEAFGIHGHSRLSALQSAEIERRIHASPLKLNLRAKQVMREQVKSYDHMEPVHLELKLECSRADDVEISKQLDPSAGLVAVYVQKPGGEIVKFRPLMTACYEDSQTETLRPGLPVYQDLHLTFGRDGFYFQDPGAYEVRAVYLGGERLTAYSNVLQIYVGAPKTVERDRLAGDFFDPIKGQLLAVGPSASSRFSAQVDFFRDVMKRMPATALGKYLAGYLAVVDGVPFKDVAYTAMQVDGVPQRRVGMAATKAKSKEALGYLDTACAVAKDPQENLSNLAVYKLRLNQARVFEASGDLARAKEAIDVLKSFMTEAIATNKDVRQREIEVLDKIKENIGAKQSPIAERAA